VARRFATVEFRLLSKLFDKTHRYTQHANKLMCRKQ